MPIALYIYEIVIATILVAKSTYKSKLRQQPILVWLSQIILLIKSDFIVSYHF